MITDLDSTNNLGICINTHNEKTAIIGYTSGTTGLPKGVEVSHRACIYSFNKFWEEVDNIQPRQNFGYITYLAWDAFSPLIHGATGIIIPTAANSDMELLKRSLVKYKVNHAFFTPSLLEKFLNSFDLLTAREALKNVNIIWVGGEIIKPQTIEMLFDAHPHVNLFNNYGPTECFVVSQGALVESDSERTKEIPAGKILPELEYILLDENNNDVTESGLGYLYIKGAALANGYHKRPDLNKKHFVAIKDKTYYETGDYCQVSEGRTISILARNSFILETETENLPVSFIEQKILEQKLVNECIIINTKKELMIFCIVNERTREEDIEDVLKVYTPDFKVIFIDETPLKASSQKINYSLLLEQYS